MLKRVLLSQTGTNHSKAENAKVYMKVELTKEFDF